VLKVPPVKVGVLSKEQSGHFGHSAVLKVPPVKVGVLFIKPFIQIFSYLVNCSATRQACQQPIIPSPDALRSFHAL